MPVTLAASTAGEVCVEWPVPNVADALGTSGATYHVKCGVKDPTTVPAGSTAVLTLLSETTRSATQACARVFNRDASAPHTGEVCCRGLRWGTTP